MNFKQTFKGATVCTWLRIHETSSKNGAEVAVRARQRLFSSMMQSGHDTTIEALAVVWSAVHHPETAVIAGRTASVLYLKRCHRPHNIGSQACMHHIDMRRIH